MANYSAEDEAVKAAAKADLQYMHEILNITDSRIHVTHQPCALCGDRNGMEVSPSKNRQGEYYFKCYSCGQNGDVLNAIKIARNWTFPQIMTELRARYGGTARTSPQNRLTYSGKPIQQPRAYSNGAHPPHVNGTANGTAPYQQPRPQLNGKHRALPIPQPAVYQPPIIAKKKQETARRPAQYYGDDEFAQAQEIIYDIHSQPLAPRKPVDPKIDVEAAEKFIAKSHAHLMGDFDRIMGQFKRGITRAVAVKYRLGFIECEAIGKFRPWHLSGPFVPSGWVIPITDADDALKGVRLHFEEAPMRKDGVRMSKCMWAPFGTEPTYDKATDQHPNHAYYGMFPHPDKLVPNRPNDFSSSFMWWVNRIKECSNDLQQKWNQQLEYHKLQVAYELDKAWNSLDGPDIVIAMERAWFDVKEQVQKFLCGIDNKDIEDVSKTKKHKRKDDDEDFYKYMFICPGELKALSAESAGLMATAPTGGETWMPGSEWLNLFYAANVWLAFDDDPPRKCDRTGRITIPGVDWAARWSDALKRHGISTLVVSGLGRKMKQPREIEELERKYAEKLALVKAAEGEDF